MFKLLFERLQAAGFVYQGHLSDSVAISHGKRACGWATRGILESTEVQAVCRRPLATSKRKSGESVV